MEVKVTGPPPCSQICFFTSRFPVTWAQREILVQQNQEAKFKGDWLMLKVDVMQALLQAVRLGTNPELIALFC